MYPHRLWALLLLFALPAQADVTVTYIPNGPVVYKDGNCPPPGCRVCIQEEACVPTGLGPGAFGRLYNLKAAARFPSSWVDPTITSLGPDGPLVIGGVFVQWSVDSTLLPEIEALSPAPAGQRWVAFRSNDVPSAGEDTPIEFSIQYDWDDGGLPVASGAASASWVSDDQDDRYADTTVVDHIGESVWPTIAPALSPVAFLGLATLLLTGGVFFTRRRLKRTRPYGHR